jgi:hypothetical protein
MPPVKVSHYMIDRLQAKGLMREGHRTDLWSRLCTPLSREEQATAINEIMKAGCYGIVAYIDTDSLDVAYCQTQNIYWPWYENDKVYGGVTNCRSTSIGDLMFHDGRTYVVDRVGFYDLDTLETAAPERRNGDVSTSA